MKNNKGTDDNRVRKLDYSIQISKIFYERLLSDDEITLFSPHDVEDMYEAFGHDNDKFDQLYLKYEADRKTPKKKIKAMAKPKPDEGYPGFFILQIFDGNPSLTCHLERTPAAVSLFHRR